MTEGFDTLIGPAWERLEGRERPGPGGGHGTSWSWRLTPPFPSSWPRADRAGIVCYAYAEGMDATLMDGVRVAAPWATVALELLAPDAPKLDLLTPCLEELGVQGVWPVSPEELAQGDPGPSVEALLWQAMGSARGADAAKSALAAFYGHWQACNGVIARAVRPRQEAFFHWLSPAR